jgi:signal transduction histidine kinase
MHLQATVDGAERVTLVFTDDGIGMSDEVRNRVFDPFFTTKLGQGGSGLGMNIVYNIVHDILGGSISIASSPGGGTRITVQLPRCAPQTPQPTGSAQDHPYFNG